LSKKPSVQQTMKIFKMLNYFQTVCCIVLLFSVSASSAEVTGTRSEKNDKVVSGDISAQNTLAGDRPSSSSGSKAWVLYAEQWELARSGESILLQPVLNQVMNAWLQDRNKKIEIQYPGGEEGEFWVQQLSDWLVALGIPSVTMVTVPGSGADDIIRFNLIR